MTPILNFTTTTVQVAEIKHVSPNYVHVSSTMSRLWLFEPFPFSSASQEDCSLVDYCPSHTPSSSFDVVQHAWSTFLCKKISSSLAWRGPCHATRIIPSSREWRSPQAQGVGRRELCKPEFPPMQAIATTRQACKNSAQCIMYYDGLSYNTVTFQPVGPVVKGLVHLSRIFLFTRHSCQPLQEWW